MNTVNKEILSTSINTLAQSETNLNHTHTVVSGKGSNLNRTNIKLRARRKKDNQNVAVALADLAKEKGDLNKQKQNWNTYYCQNTVITSNGRLYSKYCKNRNCKICQDIRTAKIINNYLPIIKTWIEPHLVTLTLKSCEEHNLRGTIQKMFDVFKRIKSKHRKRYLRGKGHSFSGVKSLECSFNIESETYNPHFHLIVENKQIGEALIKDWLEIWTSNYAEDVSQDIRSIRNTERDQIETLKYVCKSNINVHEIQNKKYISALSNIYDAMKGKRVFERFGFNMLKTDIKHKSKITVLNDFEKWEFNSKLLDWESIKTGEILCGYK